MEKQLSKDTISFIKEAVGISLLPSSRPVSTKEVTVVKDIDIESMDKGEDWVTAKDKEGNLYYFNKKTRISTWDKPDSLKSHNKESNSDNDEEEEQPLQIHRSISDMHLQLEEAYEDRDTVKEEIKSIELSFQEELRLKSELAEDQNYENLDLKQLKASLEQERHKMIEFEEKKNIEMQRIKSESTEIIQNLENQILEARNKEIQMLAEASSRAETSLLESRGKISQLEEEQASYESYYAAVTKNEKKTVNISASPSHMPFPSSSLQCFRIFSSFGQG